MSAGSELVSCPGGCGRQVHQHAEECPNCGYRAETVRFAELLGGLATMCSILVGFGLAALVTLATDDSHAMDDPVVRWAAGFWLGSSVLLLVVLVATEFTRRRECGVSRIRIPSQEVGQLGRRCVFLLWTFTLALVGIAAGVVLIGFHFSALHGVLVSIAAGIGLLILIRCLR
jgi:hypothetical protein